MPDHASDAAKLAKLSEIASERAPETIERALAAAKEELGMDVAFVSEFADERMVFRKLVGDAGSFGWREGEGVPLDDTFCRLLVEGSLPSVIPDAESDPRVGDLPATAEAGIGSYVGVPLELSDGRVCGTLCCASSEANERLGRRDVQFMRVLARLIADELEREQRSGSDDPGAAPEVPPDAAAAAREAAQTDVPGAILTLDLWFAGAARAAPSARSALEVLSGHLEPERLYNARLLLTELVTNSVRHAGIGARARSGLPCG